jgi:site-specific recombinase XerD
MKNQVSSNVDRLRSEMEYRNYSPRSVSAYCQLMAVVEKKLNKSLEQVSTQEFKAYLQRVIVDDKLSISYVNQCIGAYKLFVCDVQGKAWEDFAIKRPRRTQKLPVVLSVSEVEQLVASTKNLKHRCMLMLMYSAGLRRSELLQLKPSHIDSSRMQVRVEQGKGRKDRYTLLSEKTLQCLREYYRVFRPKVLLFEPQGRPGVNIHERTLERILKNSTARAGLQKSVSCHTLRHSFATHLLEKGVSIRLIQEFLGHTSLRTTSIYLHVTDTSSAKVKSPLDDMQL